MEIRKEAIDRMLQIIEKNCQKLKISIYLPIFMSQEKLKHFFGQNSHEFESYYKVYNNINWMNESSIIYKRSSKDGNFVHKNINNQPLQISPLNSKYLKNKSELTSILSHISEFDDKIIPIINYSLDEIPVNYKTIFEHIENLKAIIEWHLRMTPKQFREYKVKSRYTKAIILIAQEQIRKIEINFNEQITRQKNMVKEYQDEIIHFKVVMNEIRKKHKGELDSKLNSYTMGVRRLRGDISVKENILNNQLETHEVMSEKLLQVNTEQENILQKYCKKAEKNYALARDAYDQDSSTLNELKETLEIQLYIINNHYDDLKNEYDLQRVLFMQLKKEREFAMIQAFTERIDKFEQNRAALVIQRTWRAYHARISLKKKKKMRKKK